MKKYGVDFSLVASMMIDFRGYAAEIEFSYKHFAAVLDEFADEFGMVNYLRLKKERTDLDEFVRALGDLSADTFNAWPVEDKIAFWINAYNALTLEAIIDHLFRESLSGQPNSKLITSIRQIPGVWNKIKFNIMQRMLTLDNIEHEILRKQFKEPRIHFALNCASRGCPVLKRAPYAGDKLDFQLEFHTRVFLSSRHNFYIDKQKKKVYLSSIFKWYGKDFVEDYTPKSGFTAYNKKERAVLYFISLHLKDKDRAFLDKGNLGIKYLKYDWSLNVRNAQ